MESETIYGCLSRKPMIAAAGSVLWIAISYVDPGKWAAAVEGGSQLGLDLSLILLIINCTAILCQYLSASVAIATGRNLAQICSEEYNDLICILLGIQAEISMIVLDLTMVLGTAYGLHALFGINLIISVFLTGFDVVLFPLLASFLERPKARILSAIVLLTCLLLSSCVPGFLIIQPESLPSVSGMLSKLTWENSYVLMGVLGANIMPHYFYLHSSIVQKVQGHPNVSAGDLRRYHFLAILFIFIGIFMVNFMLTYLGANVLYGDGALISLTLQDVLSLSDQGFQSSIASTALIFIMFFSNQLVAETWSNGNSWRFLQIGRLHRSTIKLIAIILAFSCVLYSEAEDIFQILIFTQVVVGLLLPSSVIPLFRVASSRSIMGACRISQSVVLLTIFSYVGMFVLNIMFFIELAYGSSDWVFILKWNNGSSVPIVYLILLITAYVSICLTFWLAITPLKSTKDAFLWETRYVMRVSEIIEVQHHFEMMTENQEQVSSLQNHQSSSTPTSDLNFPETLLDSEINPHMTMAQEKESEKSFSKPAIVNPEESRSISEFILPESDEIDNSELKDKVTCISEPKQMEKSLKIKGDTQSGKDEVGESSDSRGSTKNVSESSKNDDVGSGEGSLSGLVELGCASRRQVAKIFDEFWGQLFDYFGQPTCNAKAMRFNVLLGVDSKLDPESTSAKSECMNKDSSSTRYLPSACGRAYDLLSASYYSTMPRHMDQTPATFHGYDLASYIDLLAKEICSDYKRLQNPPSVESNYIDSYSQLLRQKLNNRPCTMRPPGFHNVPVPRSSPNISGFYVPQRVSMPNNNSSQLGSTASSSWDDTALGLGFKEISPLTVCRDAFSLQLGPGSGASSFWTKQPHEQFGVGDDAPPKTLETDSVMIMEKKLLQSFRSFVMGLLKMKASGWLFRQDTDDGVDEDLIALVAMRERFLIEVEGGSMDRKHCFAIKIDETDISKIVPVPNCGNACVWHVDLVISFGVWGIHRILKLSLVESRPELWGKYTYVLNRLRVS